MLNTYAGTVNSQEPSKGKIKATYEQSQTTTSPELSFYGVRLYQVNHPDGSSTEIPDSGKAWITKDPEMPQLQIKVSPDNLPSNLTISWKLQVTYNRPINSGLPQDTVSIPANGQFTSPVSCAQPINIFQHADWSQAVNTGFFGGTATLTYSIGGSPAQSVSFTIAGKNPDPSQARSYIDQNNQGISYAYAIAKHESKGYAQAYYNQFENSGIPLHHEDDTGPGGFGVFQVTGSATDNEYKIPRKEIWNWRENIVAGINIVSAKRNYWSTIGEEHRSGALAWMNMTNLNPKGIPKGQRPQANLQMGTTVPVPDETQGALTFSDSGNFKIEEAVTIKMYNGASAHYCAWDNIGQVWKFNRTRSNVKITLI
ncbi:hypothetical protein QPK87_13275 [Kamptonema cortianum]|nr:hypothetical protein [Kamptonema cortianum]